MTCSIVALLLLAGPVVAGNTFIPEPGVEVWSAPLADFEPPEACPSCQGPRAFAVLGGTGWFLLTRSLVSTEGERIPLPDTAVDLAAGPGPGGPSLRVLTASGRYRLADGALVSEGRQGHGRPLEIAGDGTMRTSLHVGGAEARSGGHSPWGGGALEIVGAGDQWEARWEGEPFAIPGADVIDARPVGLLPDGRVVLAVTDSRDRSAMDGVRFSAVGPEGLEPLGRGLWNGDLILQPSRRYAVDPTDGSIWTLMGLGERLSLRRYDLSGVEGAAPAP